MAEDETPRAGFLGGAASSGSPDTPPADTPKPPPEAPSADTPPAGGSAGFFGGAGSPPSPPSAPPTPTDAPPSGVGAGFMGGAAAPLPDDPPPAPTTSPVPPAAAPASPAPVIDPLATLPLPPAAPPEAAPAPAAPIPEAAPPSAPDLIPGVARDPLATLPLPSAAPPEANPASPAPTPPVAPPHPAAVEPSQPLPDPSASPSEFFTRAEELYDEGYLDSAITAYRRGLDKEPENTVAINNLAMVFIEKERYAEARDELERVLATGIEDPEILSNLGYALRKMNKNPEAADVYERYLTAAPDAEDAEPIRGWIEQTRSAPAPEGVAAAAGGGEEVALLAQADAAYDAGDFDTAHTVYDQASLLNLESAAALSGKGRSQAKLGLMEEALATLREATILDPQDAESYYVVGFILRGMEKDVEAANAYEKFLAISPEAENAEKIRGWIEDVKSQHPEMTDDSEVGKLKIDKQPAWAQAMDGAPEGYGTAGMPDTEAVITQREAEAGVDVIPTDSTVSPFVPEVAALAPEVPTSESDSVFGNAPLAPESNSPFAPAPETPAAPAAAGLPEVSGNPFAPDASAEAALTPIPPAATPDTDDDPPSISMGGAVAEAAKDEMAEKEARVQEAAAGGGDVEAELASVRDMLSNGDTANALSRAQEIVGLNPELVSAKVLIARCFGQTGEFAKAAAILQNVVKAEENDEALFFLGRCQQELGKDEDAIKSFARAIKTTENDELKERAQEIHRELLTAGRAVCAICSQSVHKSELEDTDGNMVCTDCRGTMEKKAASQPPGGKPPRLGGKSSGGGRSKAPVKKSAGSLVLMLLILLFIGGLLVVGGVVGVYHVKPDLYNTIRATLTFLPEKEIEPDFDVDAEWAKQQAKKNGEGTGDGSPEPLAPTGGKKPQQAEASKITFTNPPITHAVVGVEYTHTLTATVSGTEKETTPNFTAKTSRTLAQAPRLDAENHTFTWRPMPTDVGKKPLILTFTAQAGKDGKTTSEQSHTIQLRAPVQTRILAAKVSVVPGDSVQFAVGDLTGDDKDDLLVAHGRYWSGELILFAGTGNGLKRVATMPFKGRAVGLAIGDFGGGGRMAVLVDYWQKTIAPIHYKNGRLSMPKTVVKLDGRPTLAGFGNPDGRGASGVAVLIPALQKVIVYDAQAGAGLELSHEISTPTTADNTDMIFKHLYLVDLDRSGKDTLAELLLVRLGKKRPNVFRANLKTADGKWIPLSIHADLEQTATTGDVTGETKPARPDLIVAASSRNTPSALYIYPGQAGDGEVLKETIDLDQRAPVLGLAAADLDGDGMKDVVAIMPKKILFRLHPTKWVTARLATLNPGSQFPPLGPVAVGEYTGDGADDVVYLDRNGSLIMITSPGGK